jgi:formylglycine-generating enzyme required for sulfatase activity
VSRADALSLAGILGFRLPSEAELEWLARDGGAAPFLLNAASSAAPRSRFGVERLHYGEWAADDWHPSYDGAPQDSATWRGGEPCGVFRAGTPPANMQSPEDLIFLLSAVRGQGTETLGFVGMRLAADLP